MIDHAIPLVAFPHLQVTADGAAFVVENLVFGTKVKVSRDVVELLSVFARPTTIREFCAEYDAPAASLEPLLAQFFLVPERELAMLSGGLVAPARNVSPIGREVDWWGLAKHAAAGAWVVFGAPTDVAATHAGARYGPRVVREAVPRIFGLGGTAIDDVEFGRVHDVSKLTVLDAGDIASTPGEALDVFGARIRKLVGETLRLGMRPAMIGGDHSVTWFALQEVLARHPKVGVIHFDAHSDLGASITDSLTHANVLAYVIQRPEVEVLFQVGVRTLERVEPLTRRVDEPRLRSVSARELHRLADPTAAFAALPRGIPYYVTFDIDCMDPAIAPETGAPVPGGLGYYQGLELVDFVAREFDLVGLDIVEVSGGETRTNRAAAIAGRYLAQLLLGRSDATVMTSYYHRHAPQQV